MKTKFTKILTLALALILALSCISAFASCKNNKKDDNSNATLHCEARYYDSHGNIVTLPKGHMAVIQGVENCIIAESNGVLLICKREEEQQIRQFHMDAEDKWK
jgi:hypothetical protein